MLTRPTYKMNQIVHQELPIQNNSSNMPILIIAPPILLNGPDPPNDEFIKLIDSFLDHLTIDGSSTSEMAHEATEDECIEDFFNYLGQVLSYDGYERAVDYFLNCEDAILENLLNKKRRHIINEIKVINTKLLLFWRHLSVSKLTLY